MLAKLLDWIDRQNISIGEWIAAFTGIVLIRCMLEVFSNPSSSGIIASDTPTLIHYWLAYVEILLGIACIVCYYSGNAVRMGKILLLGTPIIWMGPLLDLAISKGDGYRMTYFFDDPFTTLVNFVVFLTPLSVITPGLRIEMTFIVLLSGVYVWFCEKKIGVALKASFAVYVFLYIMFAAPSLVYLIAHITSILNRVPSQAVVDFFQRSLNESAIAQNSLHATFLFATSWRALEIQFDYFMAQLNYVASCVFLAWWLSRAYPDKFVAIMKNARFERIGFYLFILMLGMVFAVQRGLVTHFSWIDAMSLVTLAIAWACSWMFAVHTNDIADQAIDRISNKGRPLVAGILSVEEMRQIGWLWLTMALLGAWSAGYYPFFLNLVFTACYYIYSAPPLRLKRVPIVASALIAFAVSCTFLAGFFFISADKKLSAFPMYLVSGIMVIFTLGVNVRDVKDIEGDRANGILTLPILIGRYGVQVVGVLFGLGFLLVPGIVKMPILYYIAVPSALLGYAITVKKPYEEKWVFVLYFAFIILGLLLVNL